MHIGEIQEIGERVIETPKLRPAKSPEPTAPARKREKEKA